MVSSTLINNIKTMATRYNAGEIFTVRLNGGLAGTTGESFKARQNRLVSENILRKSVQLVNDLEALRNGKTLSAAPNTSGTQSDFIAQSVKDILELRQKLGIKPDTAPTGTTPTTRGSLLDKNS